MLRLLFHPVGGHWLRGFRKRSTIVLAFVAAANSMFTGIFLAVMLGSLYIERRTVKEGATTDSLASIFE